MKMENSMFFDWYNNEATDMERELHDRMSDMGDNYFQDMLFRPGTAPYALCKLTMSHENKDGVVEEYESGSDALPDVLEFFDYECFKVRVMNPKL